MTSAAASYGTLLNPTEETYWFGSAGSPLLRLNAQDPYGCLWACDEPEGWDAPPLRVTVDDRPDGHGGYAGRTTYGPRILTWNGTCVAPDRRAMIAARQRFRAVALSRATLLYTQQELDEELSLRVRPTGQPKERAYDGLAFDWTLTATAEDPFKFSSPELSLAHTTGLPVPPPGRVYDRTYPYVYGQQPEGERGAVTVTNRGDEWAQAVYVLAGPVINPVILNATTGESYGLLLTLGADDSLSIDTGTELVTLNGAPIYPALAPGSILPRMRPADPLDPSSTGLNDVRWDHDGDYTPAARLTVSSASTWK